MRHRSRWSFARFVVRRDFESNKCPKKISSSTIDTFWWMCLKKNYPTWLGTCRGGGREIWPWKQVLGQCWVPENWPHPLSHGSTGFTKSWCITHQDFVNPGRPALILVGRGVLVPGFTRFHQDFWSVVWEHGVLQHGFPVFMAVSGAKRNTGCTDGGCIKAHCLS